MEKVEDFKADQEVFENDIDMYLQIFCENQKPPIEDLTKASQSVWNAALMYAHRHVFKNREYFRSKEKIDNICMTSSTFNLYNYSLVDSICDYYIYLCMRYEKEISILGFSNLTGIPDSTIYDWGYNQRELSRVGSEICKKLQKYNEESLENKLASGKANPVGVIAILNRRHGWASPYTADSNRQRTQALTAEQLPQLGQKDPVCLPGMDKNDNSTEIN
jgi:hypothetical protein